MRLGIVSDCVHFTTPSGGVATENHILVRQMKALAEYFDAVTMCCPFVPYRQGSSFSAYDDNKFKFVKVPNRGGNSITSKAQLITTIPIWWKAFKEVDKQSDIVYQRFPNNLNIPGFFYFYFKKKKVFASYTGSWDSDKESYSYRLQKYLLKKYFRGPVWVYTTQPQPEKIHPGFSPSYRFAEWEEETQQVQQRLQKIKEQGLHFLNLVSVGAFIGYKNQQYILDACKIAAEKDIPFHLTLVGDGALRKQYEEFVAANHLDKHITFAGRKTYEQLRDIYRKSNFVVQSPLAEGFGKVPVEGFFHGVIPIISNITLASYMTGNGKRGFTFTATNPNHLVSIFEKILTDPAPIASMIINGRLFAKTQTLEAWAENYYQTIQDYFG